MMYELVLLQCFPPLLLLFWCLQSVVSEQPLGWGREARSGGRARLAACDPLSEGTAAQGAASASEQASKGQSHISTLVHAESSFVEEDGASHLLLFALPGRSVGLLCLRSHEKRRRTLALQMS